MTGTAKLERNGDQPSGDGGIAVIEIAFPLHQSGGGEAGGGEQRDDRGVGGAAAREP